MNEHILKKFDEELNKLRSRLIRMGALVQQQVELAIEALLENNTEKVLLVIKNEAKVDKLDLKIDKQCMKIFALHQPVAMDLRLVISSLSINDNMELLGDLAVNIAQNAIQTKILRSLTMKANIAELGMKITAIMGKVMDSFVEMNIDYALEAIKLTKDADEIHESNFKRLIELLQSDNSNVEPCCYLIDINRNLQFIARQSRSIAEELVFLVEARVIKHLNINMNDESDMNNEENEMNEVPES